MSLTVNEKEDVHMTVSIELERMFDILTNVYHKPHLAEHSQHLVEIELQMKANWELFKLPG